MARQIKIGEIGDYCEAQYERLLRAVVLETDSLVKQASPVDLGRFRLSWAIGENSASYQGMPKGDYRGSISNLAPKAVNYQLGSEKAGNIYSIHNNLPYAEKLAMGAAGSGKKEVRRYNPNRTVTTWASPGGGSSIQTSGPGWIQMIAKDVQSRALVAAARIGRQS
jgi:hypothetical protein